MYLPVKRKNKMFIADLHDHDYVHGIRINVSFIYVIHQQWFTQILL